MQILDTPSLTNLSHPESNSLSHNPSHNSSHQPSHQPDELVIAGKTFTSRLMTGTGKFRQPRDDAPELCQSVAVVEIVTVRSTPGARLMRPWS